MEKPQEIRIPLPHISRKNFLSWIVGLCVVCLALIPVLVPADHWSWTRWKVAVVCLAVAAIVALFVQNTMQSKEDRERDEREKVRDDKDRERDARHASIEVGIADIKAMLEKGKPEPEVTEKKVELAPPPPDSPPRPEIDGEIHRIAESPRSVAWPIVRDLFKMQGRPEQATVDTDILVEMYIVNTTKETKHIRDIRLSVEIAGKRVALDRQNNLEADDFNGMDFDYGLKLEAGAESEEMKLLTSAMPMSLAPEQPAEGWIRFLGKDINPDGIDSKTWKFVVVDSVGKEYPIIKVSDRGSKGELGLRRVRR